MNTLLPQRPLLVPGRRVAFVLPAELEAAEPPEARGLTRDAVRMLVARRRTGELSHTTFSQLPTLLEEADLVVINTSATLAAALEARREGGEHAVVHLSTQLPAGLWTLELRREGAPLLDAHAGEHLTLAGGASVTLLAPYAVRARTAGSDEPRAPRPGGGVRLWVAALELPAPLLAYLAAHGRPIRYGYVRGEWPISAYQNVYASEPGSAEMPSAGRPFTAEVLTRLVARGVGVTPLVLHTGVASLEAGEAPYPEPFRVPAITARRVNETRRAGGRVLAVGTTVVRALESAVDDLGVLHPAGGWTDLVVTPERAVRSVDGLLTGWHEPEASHLAMLEAIAGSELLEASYAAALSEAYLWHEFGDVELVLP